MTSTGAVSKVFAEEFNRLVVLTCAQAGSRISWEAIENEKTTRRSLFRIPSTRGRVSSFAPVRFLNHFVVRPVLDFALALGAYCYLGRKMDLFVGTSWEYALIGLVLHKLRVVESVVYWAQDWFPDKVSDGVHESLSWTLALSTMRSLDKIAYENSTQVWNLTDRIGATRRKWWGEGLRIRKERTVGHLLSLPATSEAGQDEQTRDGVVFLGHLWRDRGVELAIEAMSALKRRGIRVALHISSADREESFAREKVALAEKNGVIDQYRMWGYVPDADLGWLFIRCMAGLALFGKPEDVSNVAYPGKVVLYLEYGLPVIVSRDSSLATLVESNRMGFAINWNPESLADVFQLLSRRDKFEEYSDNAREFVASQGPQKELLAAIEAIIHEE